MKIKVLKPPTGGFLKKELFLAVINSKNVKT